MISQLHSNPPSNPSLIHSIAEDLSDPIIVAEDDVRWATPLCRILTQKNYNVHWHSDLNRTARAIEDTPLTAVLADVYMDSTNALKLVSWARSLQPWAYFLGMSQVEGATETEIMRLLCDDFQYKNGDPEALHKLVDKVERGIIERRRALQSWFKRRSGPTVPPGGGGPIKPVAEDESDDPNFLAYKRLEAQLRQEYLGQYVAFVGGQFVDHGQNRTELIERVYQEVGTLDILVQPVQETPEVVNFRHPFRIED